jgi:hypothetical protein
MSIYYRKSAKTEANESEDEKSQDDFVKADKIKQIVDDNNSEK